jgi:hypothetical protein
MKTRLQFCPVCQRQTPHSYKPVSWFWFIVWLVLFFPVAIIYLIVAIPRANRTAVCTVDHEALRATREDDRIREMVRAMQLANGTAQPPRRGTGFMK